MTRTMKKDNNVKVLFNTYPMAFHTPGGGEMQLLQYKKYLKDVDVRMLDIWDPQFLDHDLVHFFSSMSGSVHFAAFVKSLGLPLVVSPNLWITEEKKHQYPFDEIRTQFVLSDKVICNSESECDLLAKVFNMPRDQFDFVYNGVEDVFFEAVSPDLFIKHFGIDQPFVLNVANIEPRKNQLLLAKAMKAFPDRLLVIIGHERDPEYAKQCYAEAGDQLKYIGPLPHDSELLRSAYAACEVFALPSTLETPGLAAIEAAATGAKVLITSEGSTKEYFGEGAIYVDHQECEDITQGLSEAFDSQEDLLTQFVVRSCFSWEEVIRRLTDIYNSIVTKPTERSYSSGFYNIEKTPDFLFAWTKKTLRFKYECGQLNFDWRSVDGATVDVYVDGVLINSGIAVSSEWERFSLLLESTRSNYCSVEMIISTKNDDNGDPRGLGVAIKAVQFNQLTKGE